MKVFSIRSEAKVCKKRGSRNQLGLVRRTKMLLGGRKEQNKVGEGLPTLFGFGCRSWRWTLFESWKHRHHRKTY